MRTVYLANSGLQDGIKAALGRVPVAGDHLLLHLLVEAVHFIRQREDVAEAEGGHAVGEEFVPVAGSEW